MFKAIVWEYCITSIFLDRSCRLMNVQSFADPSGRLSVPTNKQCMPFGSIESQNV